MPEYDKVQNSGKMESFSTGSVRDSREGKGRCDLIPVHGYLRLAKHYENGAVKYGDRNWEKGQPQSRYLDSALRHLMKHLGGDRSEDHLAACAWNCFAMMEQEEKIERGLLPQELNDLPPSVFAPDEFVEKPKEHFITGTTIAPITRDVPLEAHDAQKSLQDLMRRQQENHDADRDKLCGFPGAPPVDPLTVEQQYKKIKDEILEGIKKKEEMNKIRSLRIIEDASKRAQHPYSRG